MSIIKVESLPMVAKKTAQSYQYGNDARACEPFVEKRKWKKYKVTSDGALAYVKIKNDQVIALKLYKIINFLVTI